MKYLLVLLAFFIAFAGFSQVNQIDSKGLRQGPWKKQYYNGRIMYEGSFKDGKPTGEWKRYSDSGFMKALLNYVPGTDSAHVILFNETGMKIAEGMYTAEKKTGKWDLFSENRKVADEYYVNGMKHGIARKYYESGEVLEESAWENGIQKGKYQLFLKNGGAYLQCIYKNDKRNGLFLTFYENGNRETEGAYLDNLKNGDWKYYDPSGKLLYSLKYDAGRNLNPGILDSIENLQIKELEKNRGKIIDPEKYMENPMEYMSKMNGAKQP